MKTQMGKDLMSTYSLSAITEMEEWANRSYLMLRSQVNGMRDGTEDYNNALQDMIEAKALATALLKLKEVLSK